MTPPHPYSGRLRQLVLQSTPFCNLACTYCYLPDRDRKLLMSREVLEAALRLIHDADLASPTLDVRWHAGEPLAVPRRFYEEAFAQVQRVLGSCTSVEHSVQTNAVLLDGAWADLLARHSVRVGVSIDGPAEVHDAKRITRRGIGTFSRVMRGVGRLQERGIAFDVIAVVTPATLRQTTAFMDFFASLAGLRQLGLNVEESEGAHSSEAFATRDFEVGFRSFLRDLSKWSAETGVQVREFDSMRKLVLAGAGRAARNIQNEAFAILTIGADGEAATFSPELLGMIHPGAPGGFSIGNVLSEDQQAILYSPRLRALETNVSRGTGLCRERCAYFSLCGGGAPVNKLYENGSFATTQTQHCRLAAMSVADVVLEAMEDEARLATQRKLARGTA